MLLGSLFNVPIGGWCMHLAGHMAVKFTSEKGLSAAKSRLVASKRVFIHLVGKGGWGTQKGSTAVLLNTALRILQRGGVVAGVHRYRRLLRRPHLFCHACSVSRGTSITNRRALSIQGWYVRSIRCWRVCNGVVLIMNPRGFRGFFRLAVDHKLPILPMAISGCERAYAASHLMLFCAVCVTIIGCSITYMYMWRDMIPDSAKISCVLGTPLHPRDGETYEQLRDRVRAEIVMLQTKLPPVQLYDDKVASKVT